MQVDPALPWNSSVDGGTIQLRRPLTLQQLLDNALEVEVKNGHDEVNRGYFLIYPSDSKLYITGDSLDYCITNVDTNSSSARYSELILERVHHADETLHSVSVHVPDVIVTPSLPWDENIEEGQVQLKESFKGSELENSPWDCPLKITVGNEIGQNDGGIEKVGNNLFITGDDPDNLLYDIINYDRRDRSKLYNSLQLEKVDGSLIWLKNIAIIPSYCNPRLPWGNNEGLVKLPAGISASNLQQKVKITYRYAVTGNYEENILGTWVDDGLLNSAFSWEETVQQYQALIVENTSGKFLKLIPTITFDNRARIVNIALIMPDGYYADINGFVIKIDGTNVYPVYASTDRDDKLWYKVVNNGGVNQLETYRGGTEPPEEVRALYHKALSEYSTKWGSAEFYEIDSQGIQEALTIDMINII